MKIGILTLSFNEKNLIFGCINQFKELNLRHMVLLSTVPWYGEWKFDNSATQYSFLADEVYLGEWKNEHEQFNFGIEVFQKEGYDWVLIVDADERYTKEDVKKIIKLLNTTEADAIRAPNMEVFWKDLNHVIRPHDSGSGPVIAVRTNVRFTDKRTCDAKTFDYTDATLYHFSYVRDDKEMLKKIQSFSHAEEFDSSAWFNNVWILWTEDSINLHPTVPESFPRAIYDPEVCPEEIKINEDAVQNIKFFE